MMTIEDWFQKEWPTKPHEGSIRLEFCGGEYIATIKYFIFNKNGKGEPLTDWGMGTSPDEAFSDLLGKTHLTISQLKREGKLPPELTDWTYRFLDEKS